jgi:hypothetical protein
MGLLVRCDPAGPRSSERRLERILVVMSSRSTPQIVNVDLGDVAIDGMVDLQINSTSPRPNTSICTCHGYNL